jgi:hypothetical protein
MKIVTRKLDAATNGPEEFAVLTEQEKLELGYVWEYNVYRNGYCVRTGMSKIKDRAELIRYIESGKNRLEWEAIHGKP